MLFSPSILDDFFYDRHDAIHSHCDPSLPYKKNEHSILFIFMKIAYCIF